MVNGVGLSCVYTMYQGVSLEVLCVSNNRLCQCNNIKTWYC